MRPAVAADGAHRSFSGTISTIKTHEDNTLVKTAVAEQGQGRVLVVDTAGSLHVAMLGDRWTRSPPTTAGPAASSTARCAMSRPGRDGDRHQGARVQPARPYRLFLMSRNSDTSAMASLRDIVIDSARPSAIAQFWAEALEGYQLAVNGSG